MSNLNELKPVGSLNPFARFCCTIGNLPSSYMAALSYEEQLMWFCDYLKNTIIPAVNTNAEAVAELQGLYVELKNYVNNYFDNLDVQEEINNKLDEMAENGTLERIINQEIFENINNNILAINNNLNIINSEITLAIGDSYANYSETNGWDNYLPDFLGLTRNSTYFSSCEEGSGLLVNGINNHNFSALLDILIANSNINKSTVKNIILMGGYNDSNSGVATQNDVTNALNIILTKVKNNYPNAKLYVGFLGCNMAYLGNSRRQALYDTFMFYSQACKSLNIPYLSNSEIVLKNSDLLYTELDNNMFHPNELGSKYICNMVYQNLFGKQSFNVNYPKNVNTLIDNQNLTSLLFSQMQQSITNNFFTQFGRINILYKTLQTFNDNSPLYLGNENNQKYYRNHNTYLGIDGNRLNRIYVNFKIQRTVNNDTMYELKHGFIECDTNGQLLLYSDYLETNRSYTDIKGVYLEFYYQFPALLG